MNNYHKLKIILLVTVYSSLATNTVKAEFFKWNDENNNTHYTDDRSKIPEKYRSTFLKIKESTTIQDKQSQDQQKEEEEEEDGKVESFDPLEKKQKGVILYGGGINFRPDEEGKAVFSGSLKNLTDSTLNSVVIFFQLKDKTGKVLKVLSTSVAGKSGEAVLQPEEVNSFKVSGDIEYITIVSYDYKITWKAPDSKKNQVNSSPKP